MREETIDKVIDRLNQNDLQGIYLEILSETVEHGIVWLIETRFNLEGEQVFKTRNEFYFIKNNFGEYIGAVLVMKQNSEDLHWFLKKQHRKQGKLTIALRTTILPHLLSKKEEQRITIDIDLIGAENFENSKKVAINVGFQQRTEEEFIIQAEGLIKYDNNLIKKKGMSYDRLSELQLEVASIEKKLYQIQDEYEYHIGELPEFNELRDWLKEIRRDDMELKYGEYKRHDKN